MKNITRWGVVSSFMFCLGITMTLSTHAKPDGTRFSKEDVRAARNKQPGPQGKNRSNEANQDGNKRNGKLSPDEKRALRRQINDAGQDIYRR